MAQAIAKKSHHVGEALPSGLAAHTKNALEILRTGASYYSPFFDNREVAQALTADTMYAMPILVARDMTLDRIVVRVTTLANPSNIRLGIYNDGTNLYPGTLVLDAGVVSGATTGNKEISISEALTKGIYWLVLVSDATPTLAANHPYDSPPVINLGASNLHSNRYAGWSVSFTYAALPDPFTAGGAIYDGTMPIVGYRVASLD